MSLSLLPEEVHGPEMRVRFHLSRLDTVLSKQEVQELVEAELAKARLACQEKVIQRKYCKELSLMLLPETGLSVLLP